MPAHRSPAPVVGDRYGRLVVISPTVVSIGGKVHWLCRCEVGGHTKLAQASLLRRGRPVACPCCPKGYAGNKNALKHGGRRSPEYMSWRSMKDRCLNPKATSWRYYGARGIQVCARWRDSFEDFLADVGARPGPEYSLDRIDNDGHYEPGNVRWATPLEQIHNRRASPAAEQHSARHPE